MERVQGGITCTINNRSYVVAKPSTVLKVCEQVGLLIPRFCYHDRLSIAGNCRMCLVQLDKTVKPIASCALDVSSGMRIFTNTSLVKRAREGVMEFLLANHPLDCPICDQGGECDLQDQALVFGNDRGRFYETKRAVVDKNWNHLVKTVMTRCIHCTRCQRFSTELSGQSEVLMVGRGGKSEISSFLANLVRSEVSGNVIDLCPVGALTSKPYAFTARPWELIRVNSIDLSDSLHSNLLYNITQQKVLRILPVLQVELNEEWLTDRARFLYDGFRLQRLTKFFVFQKERFMFLNWFGAFEGFTFQAGPFFGFSSVIGELPLHSSYASLKLHSFSPLKSFDVDQRGDYLLNNKYCNITRSDLIILVGLNLKRELPLLGLKLRFEQNKRDLNIIQFGNSELGLKTISGGASFSYFLDFVEGRSLLSSLFLKSKKPTVMFGASSSLSIFKSFCISLNSKLTMGVVPAAGGSQNGLLEMGVLIKPASFVKKTFSVLFANSLFYISRIVDIKRAIFFGSYGFDVVVRPNFFICPVSSSIEEGGLYLNLEGRLQTSRAAFSTPALSTLNSVFVNLLGIFGSIQYGLDLLGQVVDLAVNEIFCFSTSLERSTYEVKNILPFSSFVSSCYQTTLVTFTSKLLAESASRERSLWNGAFPLEIIV